MCFFLEEDDSPHCETVDSSAAVTYLLPPHPPPPYQKVASRWKREVWAEMVFTSPPFLILPLHPLTRLPKLRPLLTLCLPYLLCQHSPFILPHPTCPALNLAWSPPTNPTSAAPTALSLGSWFDLQCRGEALRRAERSPGPLDGTCFACTKY